MENNYNFEKPKTNEKLYDFIHQVVLLEVKLRASDLSDKQIAKHLSAILAKRSNLDLSHEVYTHDRLKNNIQNQSEIILELFALQQYLQQHKNHHTICYEILSDIDCIIDNALKDTEIQACIIMKELYKDILDLAINHLPPKDFAPTLNHFFIGANNNIGLVQYFKDLLSAVYSKNNEKTYNYQTALGEVLSTFDNMQTLVDNNEASVKEMSNLAPYRTEIKQFVYELPAYLATLSNCPSLMIGSHPILRQIFLNVCKRKVSSMNYNFPLIIEEYLGEEYKELELRVVKLTSFLHSYKQTGRIDEKVYEYLVAKLNYELSAFEQISLLYECNKYNLSISYHMRQKYNTIIAIKNTCNEIETLVAHNDDPENVNIRLKIDLLKQKRDEVKILRKQYHQLQNYFDQKIKQLDKLTSIIPKQIALDLVNKRNLKLRNNQKVYKVNALFHAKIEYLKNSIDSLDSYLNNVYKISNKLEEQENKYKIIEKQFLSIWNFSKKNNYTSLENIKSANTILNEFEITLTDTIAVYEEANKATSKATHETDVIREILNKIHKEINRVSWNKREKNRALLALSDDIKAAFFYPEYEKEVNKPSSTEIKNYDHYENNIGKIINTWLNKTTPGGAKLNSTIINKQRWPFWKTERTRTAQFIDNLKNEFESIEVRHRELR